MSVLYFEGFDIHSNHTNWSLNLGWQGVKQDGHQFLTGPDSGWNEQEYTTGNPTGTGQARVIRLWSSVNIFDLFGEIPDEIRFGFYSRADTSPNPNADGCFIGITQDSAPFNEGFYHYGVRVNGTGGLRLHNQATYFGAGYTADNTVAVGTWHHWEFYVNTLTGVMTLYKNGVSLITATVSSPLAHSNDWHLVFGQNENSENRPFDWVIDHLYITDGPTLVGADHPVEAVAVVAAVDGYDVFSTELSGGGFRGALVYEGVRYNTTYKGTSFRSEVDGGDTGENYCQVTPHFYLTVPGTDNAWSTAALALIEAWGVCFGNADTLEEDVSISPLEVRLDALCLSWLDSSETYPIVRYEAPGRIAYASGTWRKTNTALSYHAHVNDIPRDTTELSANALSLYTSAPGCLIFGRTAYPNDPDDEPLGTIGVTFAEEFRTDYRDFVRVDGFGTNFESYAISGYGIYGEGNRKFQSNYVTINYQAVDDGQAYIQGIWDYSIDADNGRWSMRQLVYRNTPDGHRHFSRRFVIRGHGKALELKFSSQEGKPFTINGWSLMVTANATV